MAAKRSTKQHAESGKAPSRIVLVGTYKGDQLTKWRGWYNYPISGEDKISESADFAATLAANRPNTNVISEDRYLEAA